jgi:hypothetical protein
MDVRFKRGISADFLPLNEDTVRKVLTEAKEP